MTVLGKNIFKQLWHPRNLLETEKYVSFVVVVSSCFSFGVLILSLGHQNRSFTCVSGRVTVMKRDLQLSRGSVGDDVVLITYNYLEPNWPLFWLESAFFWRVLSPENRGQTGSRYIKFHAWSYGTFLSAWLPFKKMFNEVWGVFFGCHQNDDPKVWMNFLLSNEQCSKPWLAGLYRGWWTTHLYGDCFIHHYKDPGSLLINQYKWSVMCGFSTLLKWVGSSFWTLLLLRYPSGSTFWT